MDRQVHIFKYYRWSFSFPQIAYCAIVPFVSMKEHVSTKSKGRITACAKQAMRESAATRVQIQVRIYIILCLRTCVCMICYIRLLWVNCTTHNPTWK